MFSDTGRVHIYPKIEQLAQQAEQLMKGQQQQ
jgi:hypothetical protein